MATIMQTTFAYSFSWMKIDDFLNRWKPYANIGSENGLPSLHMSRKPNYRDMCKIVTWLDHKNKKVQQKWFSDH